MIDWDKVYKLSASEFSEDPNKYAEPELLYSLGSLRKRAGVKMFPSPVSGALARFTGSKTSQHFVNRKELPTKRSTGSDIFMEGIPFVNYQTILRSYKFNGIGIYLDTIGGDSLPWIMFHVDIRPYGSNPYNRIEPLIWIAEKIFDTAKNKWVTKYRYPQFDSKYWRLLNVGRFYTTKKFGSGSS